MMLSLQEADLTKSEEHLRSKKMCEALLSIVGFVALVFAWRAWKKTARGAVRDCLFSLRDEWRNHYVDCKLDMQDGAYADIRNLLNGMLRYTKRMRMMGFLYFAAHASSEEVASTSSRIDETIDRCDSDTRELAKRIRRKACEAILIYMAATSLGFISAAVFMFVYFLPNRIFSAIKTSIRSVFDVKPAMLEYAVLY